MSNPNLNKILLSELFGASSYLENLFTVCSHFEKTHPCPEVQNMIHDFSEDCQELLEEKILRPNLVNENIKVLTPVRNLSYALKVLKTYSGLIKTLIELELHYQELVALCVDVINLIYSHAYEFHLYIQEHFEAHVEYPRLNLVTSTQYQKDLPLSFHLALDKILSLEQENLINISSLDFKRSEKYQFYLGQGHQSMSKNNAQEALEHFLQARLYHETAEVLTLIAWAKAQCGDLDEAKQYCLKAMKKDPDYGPPYNDLGNYLLSEGKANEGLKWFTLAKKSTYYQNREYPYINSGRAYMFLKQYDKAMIEFQTALSLAPYHEELKNTINKLKKYTSSDSDVEPPQPIQ